MAKQHNTNEEFEINPLGSRKTPNSIISELREQFSKIEEKHETRFKTIFEESTFGNKIINKDLRIIKANIALTKLLGYTEKELFGTKIIDIAHPDYVEDWKKLQSGLWSDKQTSFTIDTCIIRKDKTVIWCHVTSIIFEDKGEMYGYTILEDISDKKNLERIRNEIDAKKDEFISIVSHELRTPLTTIKAINQILEKTVSKDQNYYAFIKKSNHHILRLEKLIEDLFDVTKIVAGNVDLNLNIFDMNNLIKECISGLQTIHPTHEIRYSSTHPIQISGDEFRIEQVLINLINNAIKYSPSATKIDVELSEKEEQATVKVVDYGIGIAQNDINKIFTRFYRVNENKHHFQGLGLGLYISSEIISKHKGKFDIESKLHEGTKIWFTLPKGNKLS